MLSVTLATPSCECQQRAAGSPLVASTASWSKLSPRKRRKIDEEVAAPPLSSVCSARANNSSSSLSLASSVPGSVQSLPSPASSHPAFPELPDDKSDAGSGSWSDRSSSLEVVSCPSYATDQASPGISVSATADFTQRHGNGHDVYESRRPAYHARALIEDTAVSAADVTRNPVQIASPADDVALELSVDLFKVSAFPTINSAVKTPVPKTTSALLTDLVSPRRPQSCEPLLLNPLPALIADAYNSGCTSPPKDGLADLALTSVVTSPALSITASLAGLARPMSLKDRRAQNVLAKSSNVRTCQIYQRSTFIRRS